jgi:beta-lactam-binding protein with PASTA domain
VEGQGVRPMPPKQVAAPGRLPAAPRQPFQPRRLHEDEIPRSAPVRFGIFSVVFGLMGFVFRLGLATTIILAIAFAGGYYAAMSYIRQDEVVVPSVRGMKVESAFETLSDKALAVIRDRTEASALVAPGEIIEQRPAPGIKTKRGSTVRLVISSGRANFVVPNVVGESRENATNKIRGARFEVGNTLYLEDDMIPRDYVISQTPEAGKGMDFAGKVDLALSAGPRGTGKTMPLVSGKSLAEARTILSVAGIMEIVTEPDNAPPNAVVTSQEPPGGAMLVTGARVVLRANP